MNAGILFNEFAILLFMAVMFGFVAVMLRQQLTIAFILVGLIAGPAFLGWIRPHNDIDVLANYGVTLMLFIIGLKLDLTLIKKYGQVSFMAGIGQIAVTMCGAMLVSYLTGIQLVPALIAAFAISISSTIVVVQMISSKNETFSLHANITIATLIVQDLAAILVIIVLSSWKNIYSLYLYHTSQALSVFSTEAGLIAVAVLLAIYVFPLLLQYIAKSRDLLVLFAFSWAVLFAAITNSVGLGMQIGGLLGGMTLASTIYREAIASKLDIIRNFLLIFFYFKLGASLRISSIITGGHASLSVFHHILLFMPAVLLSLYVLLCRPFITFLAVSFNNYKKRISFMSSIPFSQVSELSLIIAVIAVGDKLIDQGTANLITIVSVITIVVSTYLMTYSSRVYHRLSRYLTRFQRNINRRSDPLRKYYNYPIDVVIYGFGRHGRHLAMNLEKNGLNVMAIDFDPTKIHSWLPRKILMRFGDAEDFEYPETLPSKGIKWLISTIPDLDANKILITALRDLDYKAKIAIYTYQDEHEEELKKLGVDLVIIPHCESALSVAARVLEDIQDRLVP